MPEGTVVAGIAPPLAAFCELAREIGDLKRVHDARTPVSVASRLFRRAWTRLLQGGDPEEVALEISAEAVASARLGALDFDVLQQHGIDPCRARQVSFDAVAMPIAPPLRDRMRLALASSGTAQAGLRDQADFVEALIAQPRAGATCPGKPRLMLEPPERHGDHCLLVAVLGAIVSGHFGAGPATPFLAGLAHHLHNVSLPDSGFSGEMLLGEALQPAMALATNSVLVTLPETLRSQIRSALLGIEDAASPEARTFHAADVIDRVLQMQHYARMAAFTLDQALDDQSLVHDGPVKVFHDRVLHDAGLLG